MKNWLSRAWQARLWPGSHWWKTASNWASVIHRPHADYGPLAGLARHRINTRIIIENWDQICRLTASLRAGTVTASAILRTLQRGPSPSALARALAELGRIIKTLHVLQYCRDPGYRRTIRHLPNRGETRNGLARDVLHGHRGQLRKHYQAGQETQLDTLGIMINIIVLWQTVYTQAALGHLDAHGHHPDPADVARLTPLGHPTINLHGRYQTVTTAAAPRDVPMIARSQSRGPFRKPISNGAHERAYELDGAAGILHDPYTGRTIDSSPRRSR